MRNGYMTYIALYIDDLLIISENDDDLVEVKRRLMEKFEMKDLGVARKFLGMEIEYSDDGLIKLHQEQYIQGLLKRHGIQDCNRVSTLLVIYIQVVKTAEVHVM